MLLSVAAGVGTTAATVRADSGPIIAFCTVRCGSGFLGGNLASHGGPVESSSTNYLIFWGPFPEGEATLNTNLCGTAPCSPLLGVPGPDYALLIERFFDDVGGTPYYGMLGQYGAGNSSHLGGVYVDPVLPLPESTVGNPLQAANPTVDDSAVREEVRQAERANGWTGGNGHNFFVILPPGITECANIPGALVGCSGTDFCGYHYVESDASGVQTPYQVIPFPDNPTTDANTLGGCTIGQSPNGDPAADDAVNVISHELFETVTDPLLSAWWDGSGNEIADKCLMTFGTSDNTGANVYLHGDPYILQREYSNRIGNCSLS